MQALAGFIGRVVGWLLVIPVALSLPALYVGFSTGIEAWWRSPSQFAVLAGLPIGLAVGWAISRWAQVFRTFEHELTHVVVGLPFGFIPYGFVVTRDRGGLVRQFAIPLPLPIVLWQMLGMHVSGLAPYSIPLIALTVGLLAPPSWAIGVGIALGYHLYCKPGEIWSNLGWRSVELADGDEGHTDIARSGYVASLALIPALALASYGFLFHALAFTPAHAATEWVQAVIPRLVKTIAWAQAIVGR